MNADDYLVFASSLLLSFRHTKADTHEGQTSLDQADDSSQNLACFVLGSSHALQRQTHSLFAGRP